VEVGRFIDEGGNNFRGVQTFNSYGRKYVAASDRDSGLYIFEHTGHRGGLSTAGYPTAKSARGHAPHRNLVRPPPDVDRVGSWQAPDMTNLGLRHRPSTCWRRIRQPRCAHRSTGTARTSRRQLSGTT